MKFDLHLHTYYSDGNFSPEEVVDLAIKRNLKGIAITDHDTVSGVEKAIDYSKQYEDFLVVPGIEFGSIYNNEEVHILGYFIDYKDSEIVKAIEFLSDSRKKRAYSMVEKLNAVNVEINYEEIKEATKEGFIGRVSIAKVLIRKGYVSNINEAFDKYLGRGKAAYTEKESFTVKETIEIIKKAGGISVLAHPGLLNDKKTIYHCIDMGIDGLECIHSKHTKADVSFSKNIANENNLIVTGGSDCHGQKIDGDFLLGKYNIDLEKTPKLKERLNDIQ